MAYDGFKLFQFNMAKEADTLGSLAGMVAGGAPAPQQQPGMPGVGQYPVSPPQGIPAGGMVAGPNPQLPPGYNPPQPFTPEPPRGIPVPQMPSPSPAASPTGRSIPATIFNRMVANGIPPQIAHGFLGNFQQESGFNPVAFNQGEGAFGYGQHRGDRLANLKKFAADRGKSPSDPETFADFVSWELKGPESGAWEKIKTAKTPEEAAALVDKFYERSDGKAVGARQSYAAQFAGDPTMASRNVPSGGDGMTDEERKDLPDMSPEAKARRARGAAFMALGKALGQLSHGQAVDVSDVLDQYLSRQDQMRQRIREFTQEQRRRVERGEDITNDITNREDVQRNQAYLQGLSQDFQVDQANTAEERALAREGRQAAREDTVYGYTRNDRLTDVKDERAYTDRVRKETRVEDFQDWLKQSSVTNALSDEDRQQDAETQIATYGAKVGVDMTAEQIRLNAANAVYNRNIEQAAKTFEADGDKETADLIRGGVGQSGAEIANRLLEQKGKGRLETGEEQIKAEMNRRAAAIRFKDAYPNIPNIGTIAYTNGEGAANAIVDQQRALDKSTKISDSLINTADPEMQATGQLMKSSGGTLSFADAYKQASGGNDPDKIQMFNQMDDWKDPDKAQRFLDFLKSTGGSTNINIGDKMEMAKWSSGDNRVQSAIKEVDAGRTGLKNAKQMYQLLSSNNWELPQGPITTQMLPYKGVLRELGLLSPDESNVVASQDTIQKLKATMLPSVRAPGQQSDFELQSMMKSLPGVENSPLGNALTLQTIMANGDAAQQRAQMMDQYLNDPAHNSTVGFDKWYQEQEDNGNVPTGLVSDDMLESEPQKMEGLIANGFVKPGMIAKVHDPATGKDVLRPLDEYDIQAWQEQAGGSK